MIKIDMEVTMLVIFDYLKDVVDKEIFLILLIETENIYKKTD